MLSAAQFLLFVFAAFGYPLAIWPLLRRFRAKHILTVGLASAVLIAPLLIGPDQVGLRALACVLTIDIWFKLLDYSRCLDQYTAEDESFRSYALFLIPFPVLLVRYGFRDRAVTRLPKIRERIISAIGFAAVFCCGFVLLVICSRIELLRSNFLLDHTVKLVIFVVSIEALSKALYAIERLAGFETEPIIQSVLSSRSVGEFWCRFNTRVHGWFVQNVFDRFGGRRHPTRGIFLTFFVSAVFHELMFGIATSRFEGYQFIFFMLQIPAILLTRSIHRLANSGAIGGRVLAHGFTLLWLGSTSVFFFHGVDRVFDFYYAADSILPSD